jgi:hypothetical protein
MAGSRIAGPFPVGGVGGGDGNDYFTILAPVPMLIDAFLLLEQARKEALKHPNPTEGRVRAAAISFVITEVGDKVKLAGVLTAKEAEVIIKNRVKQTQKRPDTIRRPGQGARKRRLVDAIRCRPLPTVIPGGGVGVGDISVLNEVVGADGTPYWGTQEFGSSHLVGKRLYGWFRQPGKQAANPSEFRTHAIFSPEQNGPPMTVKRPIPERAFLREGAAIAEVFRQKALGDAVQAGTRELQAIVGGTSKHLAPLRRVIR